MKKKFKDLSIEEFVRVICGVPKKYEFEIKYLKEKGIRIGDEYDYIKGDYWVIQSFFNNLLIVKDGNTRSFASGVLEKLEELVFDYAVEYSELDIYDFLEHKTKEFDRERCRILLKDMDYYKFLITEELEGDYEEYKYNFLDYSRAINIIWSKISNSFDESPKLADEVKQSPTLPEKLDTPEAKKWLQKAIDGGLLNDDYTITDKVGTKPQKALLAEILSEKIGLRNKYVLFENLWGVKGLSRTRYKSKEETGKVHGGELIEAVFTD